MSENLGQGLGLDPIGYLCCLGLFELVSLLLVELMQSYFRSLLLGVGRQ